MKNNHTIFSFHSYLPIVLLVSSFGTFTNGYSQKLQQIIYINDPIDVSCSDNSYNELPTFTIAKDPTGGAGDQEGLKIVYRKISGDSDITIQDGKIIVFTTAGTATIEASQPGDDRHEPAVSQNFTIKVSKSTQGLSGEKTITKHYDDPPFPLHHTASSGLRPVTYKITGGDKQAIELIGSKVTILKPGKVTITASQEGNDCYSLVQVPIEIEITKNTQTIIANNIIKEYNPGEVFSFEASADTNEPIEYDVPTNNAISYDPDTKTASILNIGDVTITARQEGNDYYYPTSETFNVKITPKTQHISANNIIKTFGDADFSIEAISNTSKLINYELISGNDVVNLYNDNYINIISGGQAIVKISQDGDDHHYPAKKEITITVLRKAQKIEPIENINKYLDEDSFTLTGSASSRLPVNFVSTNTEILRIDKKNTAYIVGKIGSSLIYAIQEGNKNYLPDTFSFYIRIMDVPPHIILQPSSIDVINGESICLTSAATGTNLLYQWHFNNTPIDGATSPSLCLEHTDDTNTGVYFVTVSNSTDAVKSFEALCTSYTIKGLLEGIKVYPNPTNGLCHTSSPLLELQEFTVYNLRGMPLYSGKLEGDSHTFSIASLPSGYYIVLIKTDKGTSAKRIMKIQ
ncbi:MAG: T9SS type A sorting domain-containing protein [Bacteroidales bacterium]